MDLVPEIEMKVNVSNGKNKKRDCKLEIYDHFMFIYESEKDELPARISILKDLNFDVDEQK